MSRNRWESIFKSTSDGRRALTIRQRAVSMTIVSAPKFEIILLLWRLWHYYYGDYGVNIYTNI